MSHARGLVTAPVIPRNGAGAYKLLSGAGVRPAWRDRFWRRAEDLSLTPFGAIGVRSRAGAPVRLTLQDRDDASSNRHPNLSFCLSMISAQTLRVCREGKTGAHFSGSCSKVADSGGPDPQRRSAHSISNRGRRRAGSLSKWRSDGGLASQRLAAPICFQGSAGTLVRFVIQAANLVTTIGLEPTSSTFGGSCSSS
jgi:hypothetical protein